MNQLLLAAVLLPLAGGAAVWLFRTKKQFLGIINLMSTAAVLALVLIVWFGTGRQGATLELSSFLYVGLSFRLDALSFFFALLFAGTWTAAAAYSIGYMVRELSHGRFYIFLLLTFAGCMGVVLAADMFTLFLFFEFMTICSYVLVIHKENREAMSAGNLYLFLGIIGGLALLLGIILLYDLTGSAGFQPLLPEHLAQTSRVVAIGICFLLGFGIKTGIVPLHIWLPRAHPVAPTPASALLSGIMIKTGAYGLFRTFYMILFPLGKGLLSGQAFGWFFLWCGLLTMLIGAFLALLQTQAKRTLAYSSVSQIGYVVLGLGAALLPFGKDLYGLTGMLFHILNHAVFKSTLFMTVGAIYVYTHTLDYSRLGGLLRKYPVATAAFIAGALGITGMPGFNGYASKTFLHHALTDLYHYNPTWVLWLAEKVFILASALTICYFIKLFVNLFLGERDWSSLPERMSPWLQAPLIAGIVIILFIGLFPGLVVDRLFAPALAVVGLDGEAIAYASDISVWTGSDLFGMVITAAVAGVIYFLVRRFSLDRISFPRWLSVERLLYQPLARGFLLFCLGPGVLLDRKVNQLYHGTGDFSIDLCRLVGKVDHSIDKAYGQAGSLSTDLCRLVGRMDHTIDKIYGYAGSFSAQICHAAGLLDKGLDSAYNKIGNTSVRMCINLNALDLELDRVYRRLGLNSTRAIQKLSAMEERLSGRNPFPPPKAAAGLVDRVQRALDNPRWNISNLNVEAIVVAIALVVVVVIFVFYGWR